jgi:hypothetical protein
MAMEIMMERTAMGEERLLSGIQTQTPIFGRELEAL